MPRPLLRVALTPSTRRGRAAAGQTARVLGIDAKTMTVWLLAGEIEAKRREDQRLPQQGGSPVRDRAIVYMTTKGQTS